MSPIITVSRINYHGTPYTILISPFHAADSGVLPKKNSPFRLLIGLFQAWHSASGIFSGRRRAGAFLDNICYLMLVVLFPVRVVWTSR